MAAVTHARSGNDTANTTSYALTPTYTPVAGDLVTVEVSASACTGAATLTSSVGGETFTLVDTVAKNGGADTSYFFIADQLASAALNSLTFVCAGATGVTFNATRISGMTKFGAAAIRQMASAANQAAAGTPSVTFAGATLTGNPVLGYVFNGTNPATITEPSGWTEQVDGGGALPARGSEYASVDSGFTSATVTWGSTSASAFLARGVELDASSGTGFSDSVDESETIGDAQTGVAAFAASVAEAGTLAEAAAAVGAGSRAIVEAPTIGAGNFAATSTGTRAVAEALAASDAADYLGGLIAAQDEAGTVAESAAAVAAFSSAIAEAPTIGAGIFAATGGGTRVVAETLSASEAASYASAQSAAQLETLSVVDAVDWLSVIAGNLRRWLVTARARFWPVEERSRAWQVPESRAWLVEARRRAWWPPLRARVWSLTIRGELMQLEKRISETVKYDVDFSQLLGLGETISTITSIVADQAGLTFSNQSISASPLAYPDGHTAPAGQVVQVTIAAGTIPAGQLSQRYLIRCKVATNVNAAVEASVYLLVNDTPTD